MSAITYKRQLDQLIMRFQLQTVAAQEWRSVAENRLKLLDSISIGLNSFLEELQKIGTIFGQEIEDLNIPTLSVNENSGEEYTMLIRQKVLCISSFTSNLTREACQVQATLNATLGIAAEALSVDRPKNDLQPGDMTDHISTASSPLREVYNEVEDADDNISDGVDGYDKAALTIRPDKRDSVLDQALGLFN